MCRKSDKEHKRITIERQKAELVQQTMDGVPVRLGTITCGCGRRRSIMHAVRCLYCDEWFCETCAEDHFGKTRRRHKQENKECDVDAELWLINGTGAT